MLVNRALSALPPAFIALSLAVALLHSVQLGALILAAGLAVLALLVHLNRATRSPWRSYRSDLFTLSTLALAVALLALLLP